MYRLDMQRDRSWLPLMEFDVLQMHAVQLLTDTLFCEASDIEQIALRIVDLQQPQATKHLWRHDLGWMPNPPQWRHPA